MDVSVRIEQALAAAVDTCDCGEGPRGLADAIRHAVFPSGARIRPRLCLAVAAACGNDRPEAALASAAALELLHCASLVHDDLPCFDGADTRRGQPSVHKAYGERLAVLAGDALIVLAFETLARGAAAAPERLARLTVAVAGAVGAPCGIAAGQAWECESAVNLERYHRAKTAALFVAASESGAIAAGADPAPWRVLGARLGEAYQVADDIRDVAGSPQELGKPVGRDAALGRPNAAREFGLATAVVRFRSLVDEAVGSIPDCPGRESLRGLMLGEVGRLLPSDLARQAA